MFDKLKFQLTLTNVVVVSFIFFIFSLGIYLVMQKITERQTDQLINLVSANEGLGKASLQRKHEEIAEHQFRYFYVKLNPAGKIIAVSPGLNMNRRQIRTLISQALSSSKNDGRIELADELDYRFVKNVLEKGLGSSIIFVNLHEEQEMLHELLIVLVIGGIFGLLFVFFGSLFLANRSLIPIKASWQRQKDFVADASHELRTPLAVIETTVDLMRSKKGQTIGSQIKWLENIGAENKRMAELVRDLLFLARTDSGQVLLEMRFFPLFSALLEAYLPFEAVALQRGIRLNPCIGPQIDFWGDEAKLKQLVVILVDNAIKHTPAGGEVGLTLDDAGGDVKITVTDNGEGIGAEHLNKIFQRFYRVDKARSRKEGSVGLGLAIAEWIVKEHHGSIKVESILGQGTKFIIVLPQKILK